MNAYVASVIENVKKKHSNEPEFVQTVEEVLTSIAPMVDKHPEYEKFAGDGELGVGIAVTNAVILGAQADGEGLSEHALAGAAQVLPAEELLRRGDGERQMVGIDGTGCILLVADLAGLDSAVPLDPLHLHAQVGHGTDTQLLQRQVSPAVRPSRVGVGVVELIAAVGLLHQSTGGILEVLVDAIVVGEGVIAVLVHIGLGGRDGGNGVGRLGIL